MNIFIFDFEPDLDWLNDLARFVKSPPGVSSLTGSHIFCLISFQAFETVVPSERMRIQLNVANGTIRAFTASERKAMIFYIEDMECSTDLLGSSSDRQLKLSVPALFIFITDDLKSLSRDINFLASNSRGKEFWRVSIYTSKNHSTELR